MRSTRFALSSTGSGSATSTPSTLAWMTERSASRYSSLYFAGSNASVIASTSCSAIRSSAGLKSNSSSGRSSSFVERISSGQWSVVRSIVSSNGSSAASASRSLITTLQIAVSSFSVEHLAQEVERLAADLVGLDVVGLLRELRVLAGRLVTRRELLDLDGPDRLERDLVQVLVRDHHVLVGGVLVALHGLAAGDDLLVLGAPDLHLDPREVLLVEHVEADGVVGLGRGVELHRDGDEAELDGPFPHRACHGHAPSRAALGVRTGPGPARPDRDGDSTTRRQAHPRRAPAGRRGADGRRYGTMTKASTSTRGRPAVPSTTTLMRVRRRPSPRSG